MSGLVDWRLLVLDSDLWWPVTMSDQLNPQILLNTIRFAIKSRSFLIHRMTGKTPEPYDLGEDKRG